MVSSAIGCDVTFAFHAESLFPTATRSAFILFCIGIPSVKRVVIGAIETAEVKNESVLPRIALSVFRYASRIVDARVVDASANFWVLIERFVSALNWSAFAP